MKIVAQDGKLTDTEILVEAEYVFERGAIYNEQAYIQGKMLDNSDWHRLGILPNKITPSDIDLVFDKNGKIIFCELSSHCATWQGLKQVKYGQHWLYESIVKNGPHCAVLALAQPVPGKLTNTVTDVISFQVMLYDFGVVYSAVIPGEHWRWFVTRWFKNDGPELIRRHILGASVKRPP